MSSKVDKLYNQIIALKRLTPSTEVNNLFSELVNQALDESKKIRLDKTKVNKLQEICATAEFELEKHWATKIIKSKEPLTTMLSFPYYQNYLDLTKLEYFTLKGCSAHKDHNYLFIGGGPLPMTAIILASIYKCKVTILDIDTNACEMAKKVIEKIGLNENIDILNVGGSEYKEYVKFNVIFVAALAGLSRSTKDKILNNIKKQALPKTHILARSSWGNRKLLYKPLSRSSYKIFEPVIEVHPHSHIVNSVVILSS